MNLNCGSVDDGCGTKLNCGTCAANEACKANVCGACTPKTCESLGKSCGKIDDGCGHTIACPGCVSGQVCLTNGTCCQPLTCGNYSGVGSDGCGGTLVCNVG
jgi:hypothetical protein